MSSKNYLISIAWWIFIFGIICYKYFLIDSIPILARCTADYDDYLFINLANSIARGEWLGAFSDKTFTKPPFYSIFIALNYYTGIPLKNTEFLFYIGSVLLLYFSLRNLFNSKIILGILLLLLLFNPYIEVNIRTLRINIYTALVLYVIAFFSFFYSYKDKNILLLALTSCLAGIAFFLMFITREEGVWMLPFIIAFIGYIIVDLIRKRRVNTRPFLRIGAILLFIPVFFSLDAWLKYENKMTYGAYMIGDMDNKERKEAFKSIYRVNSEKHVPFLLVDRKTRKKMYEVSPSFKKLGSHMEQRVFVRNLGCMHYPETCGDVSIAMFYWYFREAMIKLGIFNHPTTVKNFYQSIANELNAACEAGTLDCATNMPEAFIHLKSKADVMRVWDSLMDGCKMMFNGTRMPIDKWRMVSLCSEFLQKDRLDIYRTITNSTEDLLYTEQLHWEQNDLKIEQFKKQQTELSILFKIQEIYNNYIFPLSCLLILFLFPYLIFKWMKVRNNDLKVLFISALLFILVFRLGIFSLVDATSFKGIIGRYIHCLFPLLLILSLCLLDTVLKLSNKPFSKKIESEESL